MDKDKHIVPQQLSFFKPASILPFENSSIDEPFTSGLVRETFGDETRYNCAVDIVAWAKGENYDTARQSYNNYKKTIETDSTVVNFTPVEFKARAADGKLRKTDFLTDEQMLRLLTEIPGKLSGKAKDWLARVGRERIEETQNPELAEERRIERRHKVYESMGHDDQWIAARDFSIETRKSFTTAIYQFVNSPDFAKMTNDVYQGVFHKDTKGLRQKLGLNPNQNPRDHFSRIALYYTAIAEEACTLKLSHLAEDELVPLELAREVIQLVSNQVGMQADEMGRALGIDITTGRHLLSGGN